MIARVVLTAIAGVVLSACAGQVRDCHVRIVKEITNFLPLAEDKTAHQVIFRIESIGRGCTKATVEGQFAQLMNQWAVNHGYSTYRVYEDYAAKLPLQWHYHVLFYEAQ